MNVPFSFVCSLVILLLSAIAIFHHFSPPPIWGRSPLKGLKMKVFHPVFATLIRGNIYRGQDAIVAREGLGCDFWSLKMEECHPCGDWHPGRGGHTPRDIWVLNQK